MFSSKSKNYSQLTVMNKKGDRLVSRKDFEEEQNNNVSRVHSKESRRVWERIPGIQKVVRIFSGKSGMFAYTTELWDQNWEIGRRE
ncbi:unnamed protein product [Allacma fusca]|uniref:Uncharacterized protein n=1 Tax=Allacma fusca TaxID=39272 RepID=A0A8J2LIB3_9HEXA|nr:unnamed protein product [Allacma fusca]